MSRANVRVQATCLSYSLLTKDSPEFGPGVRTRDKGILIQDILSKADEGYNVERLAEYFGTTTDHIIQAIMYTESN